MLAYAFARRVDEEETATILFAENRASRAMRAWAVRCTGGSTDEAAARAPEGVASFGHKGRFLIKKDNEFALK
eukprot:8071018-Lingulodinium_polyedra.AAC.1